MQRQHSTTAIPSVQFWCKTSSHTIIQRHIMAISYLMASGHCSVGNSLFSILCRQQFSHQNTPLPTKTNHQKSLQTKMSHFTPRYYHHFQFLVSHYCQLCFLMQLYTFTELKMGILLRPFIMTGGCRLSRIFGSMKICPAYQYQFTLNDYKK